MALKTKVKAGRITNLSDARYCAGMGVDWLSFPCSSVDPQTFKEITGWVSGPECVIDISLESDLLKVKEYSVRFAEISWVQLTPSSPLPEIELIVRFKGNEWKAAGNQLLNWKNRIAFLDFEESTGNLDEDRKIVEQLSTDFQVYVGFPMNSESIDQILQWPISGISLQGGDEERPGLRDYSSLSTILELLEVEV